MRLAILCTGPSVLETWPAALESTKEQNRYDLVLGINNTIEYFRLDIWCHADDPPRCGVIPEGWYGWNWDRGFIQRLNRVLPVQSRYKRNNSALTFPTCLEMVNLFFPHADVDIYGNDVSLVKGIGAYPRMKPKPYRWDRENLWVDEVWTERMCRVTP